MHFKFLMGGAKVKRNTNKHNFKDMLGSL